jgi:type IV pilus assembly protein PilE
MSMFQRPQKGFTLIELMIVVAVVALLSMLAIYNYNRYGFRARRAEGREIALRVAAAEERYYTNYNAYTDDTAALKLGATVTSENKNYLISIGGLGTGNQAYKVTAKAQGGQAGDVCKDLSVDNLGAKTFSGSETNGHCW